MTLDKALNSRKSLFRSYRQLELLLLCPASYLHRKFVRSSGNIVYIQQIIVHIFWWNSANFYRPPMISKGSAISGLDIGCLSRVHVIMTTAPGIVSIIRCNPCFNRVLMDVEQRF